METVESLSQSSQLHSDLPNYAEKQRVQLKMSMLDVVAAEAAPFAELQTQRANLATVVDSSEKSTMAMAGHVATRMAVTDGEGWRPVRMPPKSVTTVRILPGGVLGSPVEQTDMKSLGRSEPQGSRMEQNKNNDTLRKMFFDVQRCKAWETNAGGFCG